jgi:hypothetical protein
LRFALETAQRLRILGDFIGQELQSDEAVEAGVLGLVDDTHAAAPELFQDAVVRDCLADHWAEILGPEVGQVNERIEIDLRARSQLTINRDCSRNRAAELSSACWEVAQFGAGPNLGRRACPDSRASKAARGRNGSGFSIYYRRGDPYFYAFDLLRLNGEDLREWTLLDRKRALRKIVPRTGSRPLYVDHFIGRGEDLFRLACARDLEGVVAKWKKGRYMESNHRTSWVKINNRKYSQSIGREKLFEKRAA